MDRIEDGEKADKLARAIMSDITLYNSAKLANVVDPTRAIADEIEEGRALFRSRVASALHGRFEVVLNEWAQQVASEGVTVRAPTAEDERLRQWRVGIANDERAKNTSDDEGGDALRRKRTSPVYASRS